MAESAVRRLLWLLERERGGVKDGRGVELPEFDGILGDQDLIPLREPYTDHRAARQLLVHPSLTQNCPFLE